MKKLSVEPRLPIGAGAMLRVNELFRAVAVSVNELIDRASTPLSVSAVTVGASPFDYLAARDGFVSIVGGTVSAVALIRQGASTSLGVVAVVPVKKGDTVRITYTVAPTVNLV
jgi:hypothetical protein